MASIAVQAIAFANNQITILFNQNWFQEDINSLSQLLFNNITNIHIKEVTVGADLEHIRFQWQDTEFIMHFEYYSQSCWLDTQDPQGVIEINSLFTLLQQNNKQDV